MECIARIFTLVFSFICKHHNSILDFLGLISSIIIPLYIFYKTIKHEKAAAKQDAHERERQYQESIKLAEQRHNEQLKVQEDISRIVAMSFCEPRS